MVKTFIQKYSCLFIHHSMAFGLRPCILVCLFVACNLGTCSFDKCIATITTHRLGQCLHEVLIKEDLNISYICQTRFYTHFTTRCFRSLQSITIRILNNAEVVSTLRYVSDSVDVQKKLSLVIIRNCGKSTDASHTRLFDTYTSNNLPAQPHSGLPYRTQHMNNLIAVAVFFAQKRLVLTLRTILIVFLTVSL